jgi:hypothetical protein
MTEHAATRTVGTTLAAHTNSEPQIEVPVGACTVRRAGRGFPITLRQGEAAPIEKQPPWLSRVREAFAAAGPHLAWDNGEDIETTRIRAGVTRIGRSFLADIGLIDATVSRRHALIHRSGETCVILDDHSLNGVFVGGDRVDWRPLADGDEIGIGRFRLYFIDTELHPPGVPG